MAECNREEEEEEEGKEEEEEEKKNERKEGKEKVRYIGIHGKKRSKLVAL